MEPSCISSHSCKSQYEFSLKPEKNWYTIKNISAKNIIYYILGLYVMLGPFLTFVAGKRSKMKLLIFLSNLVIYDNWVQKKVAVPKIWDMTQLPPTSTHSEVKMTGNKIKSFRLLSKNFCLQLFSHQKIIFFTVCLVYCL